MIPTVFAAFTTNGHMPAEQAVARLDRIHRRVDAIEHEIKALADASWGPGEHFETLRALPEEDVAQLRQRLMGLTSRLNEVATLAAQP